MYVDAECDQNAGMSTALPSYSFDNIGPASAILDGSMSAAANSGRYIQDDPSVMLPDGTYIPLSSLAAAADSSAFASTGMVDGNIATTEVRQFLTNFSADHNQAQPMTVATPQTDSVINNDLSFTGGSDSLNLGAEGMTSEDLVQYLQTNPVLTEMPSEEFHRQFDGIVFQQANDSAARPPQFSEH